MLSVRIIAIASLLMLGWGSASCEAGEPFENQWGPFSGRVVDAETGQPIPGAIFVVIWMRSIPTPAHAAEQFNDARVAVTDADGRFAIPPRDPPWLSFLIENPYLTCLAPGYAPGRIDVGFRSSPISIALKPLSVEDRRRGKSDASDIGMIPRERLLQLETNANDERSKLGLRPVGLASGDIEHGGGR